MSQHRKWKMTEPATIAAKMIRMRLIGVLSHLQIARQALIKPRF